MNASKLSLTAGLALLLIANGHAGEAKPVTPAPATVDIKPAAPKEFKYRLYGLCCPERERDLRVVVDSLENVKLVSVDYDSATATFLYDPATILDERLKQMSKKDQAKADLTKLAAERLETSIKQASQYTFSFAPPALIPKDKLKLVEIPVVGIDCKACSFAAYEAIYKIDGVDQANASFKKGFVTAWIDPAKTNREALEAVLKKKSVELKLPPVAPVPTPAPHN